MDWDWEPSKKEQKRERKIAQSTDRSRFKKTDLNKRQESEIPVHLPRGRVSCVRSEEIDVLMEDGTARRCSVRGGLRKEDGFDKRIVAVGDWVRIEPEGASHGAVVAVEPRTTTLTRAEHFQRRKRQVVAANIDQVGIIMSIAEPSIKPALLDRFLIAAEKGGLRPLIVFTKTDLKEQFPQEAELADELTDLYRGLGIAVVQVHLQDQEGLQALQQELLQRMTVFSGQSGVGKSSLITALTGQQLRTASVVKATGKGSHTTTQAQLMPLPSGGALIDTPGLRSFGVWALQPEEVQGYFPEIMKVAQHCKYRNCTHSCEPECAVLKAVEEGEISDLRYGSYRTLYQGGGVRDLLDWLEAE